MIITAAALANVFTGFKAAYSKGFEGAATQWANVAMKVPSTTEKESYGWLGQIPGIREWIGDRIINSLMAHGFEIANKDFESTIAVPRNKIEDDLYGIFSPLVEEMGRTAATHPDELVFSLLAKGFAQKCFDGQYFFDADHPVGINDGETVSASNVQAGAGEPWYLLDTSRAIRPLIYQERRAYNLVSKTDPTDDNVFLRKEYVYGVDGRSAAGFGLWQLAFGSKATLDAANYKDARAKMQSLKGDAGRPLGVKPTVLIVGPNNEDAALNLINAATLENGSSNPWHKTVEVIVTPWAA